MGGIETFTRHGWINAGEHIVAVDVLGSRTKGCVESRGWYPLAVASHVHVASRELVQDTLAALKGTSRPFSISNTSTWTDVSLPHLPDDGAQGPLSHCSDVPTDPVGTCEEVLRVLPALKRMPASLKKEPMFTCTACARKPRL